jgi:hypothetical protein
MSSYYFLRMLSLLFLTYITVEQVARTKSTARPMTIEELAAAGLPADPEAQKTAQLPEGHSSPAASGSRSHEDPVLPVILDVFSVKIHQLSPTSFLEVSKFIWIMKTFGCNFGADAFARVFELVIVPDVIKVNDGQFYEAHYTRCTFNTRRDNTRKGITRIQIAPCCKTNFTEDWSSYWFYVKVDMSTIPGYEGPAHPLSSPFEALTVVSTTAYNHRATGIRSCENAFHLASTILGGRDIIEEFVASRIWPISYGWAPTEIVNFNVKLGSTRSSFPEVRHSTEGRPEC